MQAGEHSDSGAPPSTPWIDPDRFIRVVHPQGDAEWDALRREHVADDPERPDEFVNVSPKARQPLARIFEIVRDRGCVTVLIEHRYVDVDYRSEYTRYWSKTFAGRPAFARRIHFFEARIEADQLHDLPPQGEAGYLGYTVIRPIPRGPVGRTVIVPSKHLEDLRPKPTLTLVQDRVQIAGRDYTVEGAPFAQQDGQLIRCAHVAAWSCHYSAYLRGLVGRQTTASFVDAAPGALSYVRLLPSQGMNLPQLQATFAAFDTPAVMYDLNRLPHVGGVTEPAVPPPNKYGEIEPGGHWDTRMFSIICRYLNSGFPVIVGTNTEHAFTLVGWYRNGNRIRFIANDDVRGPYQEIDSPFSDIKERLPWRALMIPMPPNAFLDAESAEDHAYASLVRYRTGVTEMISPEVLGEELANRLVDLAERVKSGEKLKLRTALRTNREYKAGAAVRGLSDRLVRILRLAHLPHYMWAVEVHDADRCATGQHCVVAELVFDSTSENFAAHADLQILPGLAITVPPDGVTAVATHDVPQYWKSSLMSCGTFYTDPVPLEQETARTAAPDPVFDPNQM